MLALFRRRMRRVCDSKSEPFPLNKHIYIPCSIQAQCLYRFATEVAGEVSRSGISSIYSLSGHEVQGQRGTSYMYRRVILIHYALLRSTGMFDMEESPKRKPYVQYIFLKYTEHPKMTLVTLRANP